MDGIMGLSREPGDGFSPPTFMQVLQQNKAIKSNIFGINLERAADKTNDGEISFGTIDTTKFKGDLNYLDTVGDNKYWSVPVDGFAVNGKFQQIQNRVAVIDTGTSFMFLPPDDAKALFSQIPGSSLGSDGSTYNVPCDSSVSVAIVFNGIAYNISPKDYVGNSGSGGQCTSHIFGQIAVDEQTWLIGDTFLKNVYTVFDMDQNRIGKFGGNPFVKYYY
jgi:cathepsin D